MLLSAALCGTQFSGLDIRLKVGILAEIGYMLHKCALVSIVIQNVPKDNGKSKDTSF